MDKTDSKFQVWDIRYTPLFTRDTYEKYICIKSKEDMKTKMIICENPVKQKMKQECYFRKKFTLFGTALLDNNQQPPTDQPTHTVGCCQIF